MIIDLEKLKSVNFAHGILGGRVGGGKSPLNRFAAGSASSWVPTDVSGLTVWLDASDNSTIHEDDAAGRVSQWDDKSGNLNHVSQTTAANQPDLLSADQNGLDVVRCNSAGSHYIQRATFTGGAVTQGLTMLYSVNLATVSNAYVFDGGGATNRCVVFDQNNEFTIYAGTLATTGLARETIWRQLATIFDGASSSFRRNSVEEWTPGTNPGTDSLNGITISARYNGASFGNNRYGEILIYDSVLAGADLSNAESYLQNKWN